jgi:hypothetical protein
MSGMLELEIKGKAGDKIFIYPAEKLDKKGDADQMAKNWMMIDNCITYIIGEDDKWEKCESVFAYFAGRYIAVEGEAEIRNVRANAITSATKRAGTFTCDDDRFNKIYDLVEKAVEANMLSVHTDCPTEDNYDAGMRYLNNLKTKINEDVFFCYKSWDHPDETFLTQAAQALPLYWGMVPKEKEEDIAKALLYTLKRDGSFICGDVGQPYVSQCAKRFGMNDLIVKHILKEEHPSYYAFVLEGETTLGEYWENNPRSHCHNMMGHIVGIITVSRELSRSSRD